MAAYYNEIEPYAAQWLRNLVAAGHIAPGDVDERSIKDVKPDDLRNYTQCHFFAGIGGWSVALRMAGWPDDRPVWSGSCPCQPFSAAGAGKAFDDERHLWPSWLPLIAERRPPVVFGEQVEAAIGWGWLDAVFSNLETQGYACGATVLPACGVGAPHIRQRAWFVADTDGRNAGTEGLQRGGEHGQWPQDGSVGERLADPESRRFREFGDEAQPGSSGHADRSLIVGGMGNPAGEQAGLSRFPWQSGGADWLPCTDGKSRPVEPGSFPLAHGIQRRTSKLRAYGNAIVPQIAAEFIRAYSE